MQTIYAGMTRWRRFLVAAAVLDLLSTCATIAQMALLSHIVALSFLPINTLSRFSHNSSSS